MIKICYIVTVPITIKSFFVSQLKFLSENGYDVTVICGNDDDLEEILGEKIKFVPINFPRGISMLGSIKSIIELKKFFKSNQFDMVQYSTPNASLYASIASKFSKIPVRIYHLMGYKYLGTRGILKFILKTFERISCGLSTSVECVSNSNLKIGIKERFFKESKARVIGAGSTGGVDLKKFDINKKSIWRSEGRVEFEILNGDMVLGFCGRITKDKGIDELFEAYLKLKLFTNIKLLIVGNFENKEALDQQLYKKIERDKNVIFLPHTQDIEKRLAIMDILVLPSHREGFGNVIIEAAAMGIPTVASNIPGPSDAIIDNRTGLLHEVKNSNDLELKLKKITSDMSLLCELSENAYNYVCKNFDSDLMNINILKNKNSYFK